MICLLIKYGFEKYVVATKFLTIILYVIVLQEEYYSQVLAFSQLFKYVGVKYISY